MGEAEREIAAGITRSQGKGEKSAVSRQCMGSCDQCTGSCDPTVGVCGDRVTPLLECVGIT